MAMGNEDYSAKCHQIYQAINERQVKALMFHDQTADLYEFLGLMGFKRLHKYHFLCETLAHRKTKEYYMEHHRKLLAETEVTAPDVVPDDWYKYTRDDVTVDIRKKQVESSFQTYRKWERETLDQLCLYAKALFDIGYIADFTFVQCIIEEKSCNLKCLERLILTLASVKYSEEYIAEIQDELHDKYKKAAKKLL